MKVYPAAICISILLLSFKGPDKKRLAAGQALFKKYSCSSCHGETGVGIGNLTKAYLKYSDEEMVRYIKNPSAYNNLKMPKFETIIQPQDYELLIAYVKHLGQEASLKSKK